MIRSALMTVMTSAAIKAGRGLKRDFGEVSELQVSMKGPGDFVSLADQRSEKSLYEELAKARPGYGFVMEESGRVEGTDKSHTWHIDPLDATTNFLHAIPLFAISIALKSEDAIIAYTWDKYMRTGDERWPLRLPMTKSAVRGMDMDQAYEYLGAKSMALRAADPAAARAQCARRRSQPSPARARKTAACCRRACGGNPPAAPPRCATCHSAKTDRCLRRCRDCHIRTVQHIFACAPRRCGYRRFYRC